MEIDQDPMFNKRANEFSKSAHWATILLFFFSFSFFFILCMRFARRPAIGVRSLFLIIFFSRIENREAHK